MSERCPACRVYNCTDTSQQLVVYSLQDSLAFNGVPLSFTVECPTGFFCAPGSFPRIITFPPGTFQIVLPPPPVDDGPINGGQPIVLQLQGCQSLVTKILAANTPQSVIQAAAQAIIMEVAAQQAECSAIPTPPGPPKTGPQPPVPPPPPGEIPIPGIPPPGQLPPFTNKAVYYVKTCPVGYTLTLTGSLPPWVTFDVANNRLIGLAGTFGAPTQTQADLIAQNVLNNLAGTLVLFGTLFCAPPAPTFDWNNLVWNDPPTTQINGGTGIWDGDNWSVHTLGGSALFPATADNQATMTITTASVIHCRLTVTVLTFSVGDPGDTNCPITIDQDATNLVAQNVSTFPTPGTYPFDFDIQPGTNSVIAIQNAAAQSLGGGEIEYSAILTVLP